MLSAVTATEQILDFPCFGGTCSVIVAGDGELGTAEQAAGRGRTQLLEWHERFSRFIPASELSRLNADPRRTVPASPLMLELAHGALVAARRTDGLVDATLVESLERAGYATSFVGPPLALEDALALAPPRRPGVGDPQRRWAQLSVDFAAGTITRPPGLQLDSGGLLKGMLADRLADELEQYDAYVVNCCGDLRVGGRGAYPREVTIEDPFAPDWMLHSYDLTRSAVATSAIARRSWLGACARPMHHLLSPATGEPVFSGVVQVTALAPTAFEAELRSKAALLAGPGRIAEHLPDGGLAVLDDGSALLVAEPAQPPRVTITREQNSGQLRVTGALR
jgi:thiamine biosynthesis lipoprotein